MGGSMKMKSRRTLTYFQPAHALMRTRIFMDGRFNATMGIAESGVEVYDGTKYQLRVELLGGGSV
jgi:hypothetical protein